MRSIAIFCGAKNGTNGKYTEAAHEIGYLFAKHSITLIYGGGSLGMMGTVANAALQAGGKVIGVIPTLLVDKEEAKNNITELHIVDSMQSRKAKIIDLADGFIVLPGGVGTLDELFEVMTFNNLGMHRKLCGILNTDGFYDSLVTFMDHATDRGFIRQQTRDMLILDRTPEKLLEKMVMAYK